MNLLAASRTTLWPFFLSEAINSFVNELVNYGPACCDTVTLCAWESEHWDQGKKVNFNGNFHQQPRPQPHTFMKYKISTPENGLIKGSQPMQLFVQSIHYKGRGSCGQCGPGQQLNIEDHFYFQPIERGVYFIAFRG